MYYIYFDDKAHTRFTMYYIHFDNKAYTWFTMYYIHFVNKAHTRYIMYYIYFDDKAHIWFTMYYILFDNNAYTWFTMYYIWSLLYIITVTLPFSNGFSTKYSVTIQTVLVQLQSNPMVTNAHCIVTNTFCRETML